VDDYFRVKIFSLNGRPGLLLVQQLFFGHSGLVGGGALSEKSEKKKGENRGQTCLTRKDSASSMCRVHRGKRANEEFSFTNGKWRLAGQDCLHCSCEVSEDA